MKRYTNLRILCRYATRAAAIGTSQGRRTPKQDGDSEVDAEAEASQWNTETAGMRLTHQNFLPLGEASVSGLHQWCFDISCWVTDSTSNLCHLCPRFFCVQQLEEEYLGEQLRGSPEYWPLKVEVMVVVLLWELYPSSPGLLHIYIFSLYRSSDTHHISCCIWYFNHCLSWCYLQASEIEEEGPEGKFAAIQTFQSCCFNF